MVVGDSYRRNRLSWFVVDSFTWEIQEKKLRTSFSHGTFTAHYIPVWQNFECRFLILMVHWINFPIATLCEKHKLWNMKLPTTVDQRFIEYDDSLKKRNLIAKLSSKWSRPKGELSCLSIKLSYKMTHMFCLNPKSYWIGWKWSNVWSGVATPSDEYYPFARNAYYYNNVTE